MPKEKFDALEAINIGMKFEADGHMFYTQAAEITQSPKGKKMFERLAHDELEHLQLFKAQKDSLLETGQWLKDTEQTLARRIKTIGKPVFPKVAGPGSGATGEARERDALRRGIKAEKDSIAFYTQAAQTTKDPEGKAMFEQLVEVEEGHLLLLEAEYDYVTQSGFYFGLQEFSLEGPD